MSPLFYRRDVPIFSFSFSKEAVLEFVLERYGW